MIRNLCNPLKLLKNILSLLAGILNNSRNKVLKGDLIKTAHPKCNKKGSGKNYFGHILCTPAIAHSKLA